MTTDELTVFARELGIDTREFVLNYVNKAVSQAGDRLAELLEARIAAIPCGERGEKGESGDLGPIGLTGPKGDQGDAGLLGEKGDPGEPGQPGAAGDRGERGEKGEPGIIGERGERGEKGIDGEIGPRSPEGAAGRDGLHGRDGLQGVPGEKGEKGVDGTHGKDGRDGSLENIRLEQDGRMVRAVYKDSGALVDGWEFRINAPEFRDTYVESRAYEKDDLVQWDGSGWIALRDSPPMKPGTGKPEVTGWKLWIKKGAAGRDGKPGADGERGLPGPAGPVREKW